MTSSDRQMIICRVDSTMGLADREECRALVQEVLREILPQELEQSVKKQEERAGRALLMERVVRVEEA
ncbi:MAG: hypothetical protein R6V55_04100 [Desulfovermiculus sp.]